MTLPCRDDWQAVASELAYALRVHLYGGRGEFAEYSIPEANEFAQKALERFDALNEEES